jgi:hypothetical protein
LKNKNRLLDVDLLINRILVYGVLTGSLALVYFVGVMALQTLFHTLTGHSSQLAVVTSTLAVAALFSPLRRRIQGMIDRRFYRRKYDAAQALAAFSATMRDETDLDQLAIELLALVQRTLQPAHASLWLKPTDVEPVGAGWSRGKDLATSHGEETRSTVRPRDAHRNDREMLHRIMRTDRSRRGDNTQRVENVD